MPVHFIDELDDARLDPYRDLTKRNLMRWSGRFIVEGWRVVDQLLRSEFPVESVLLSQRRRRIIESRIPPNVDVFIIPQPAAERLLGYNFHGGVLACGVRRRQPDLAEIMQRAAERFTLVACPAVNNPENLGSVIRLSAAFGVQAVLLGSECTDPFSRRVLRISMGTAFHVPILECRDLAAELEHLDRRWRVELPATVLDAGAEPLERAQRTGRLSLLLGNESGCLAQNWIDLCHRKITIPLNPRGDSLNVAVTAGIILHHFTRIV